MIERTCAKCGTSIDKADGFVLARDWLRMAGGAPIVPRELCGLCALHLTTGQIEFDGHGMPREVTQKEIEALVESLPPPRVPA